MDSSALKQFAPFNALQDEYLEEARKNIKHEQVKKGQMLFKRGRAIATRYFVLKGQIDLIDSNYQKTTVSSGTELASIALNQESPTRCSALVKDGRTEVFSIDAETLDRLVAWSESADAAFESEMSAKKEKELDQESFSFAHTGQFPVVTLAEEQDNDWMSALLKAPLFTRIPLTHVQDLFARFTDHSVESGEVIIKEGEKGDYFYVIAGGQARVVNHLKSIDVTLEPGNYFGEEALLGSTLRNATVTMLTDGEVKRLTSEDFKELLIAPILRYVEFEELDSLDGDYKLLDVKMPLEYRVNHVKGAINVPLSRLRTAMEELGTHNTYVVSGDAGSRADIAAHLLCQAGFEAVILKTVPDEATETTL